MILRWLQRGLFAGAISLLAYCAVVLASAWIFQQGERRQLERLLADRPAASGGARLTASSASPKTSLPAATHGLIGRMDIPRLGVSVMVIEGTSGKTLRRAVGHIRGTALPGEPGNVGISGHRDTFFRPLRNIHQNDIITLTTPLGEYRYRVVSTRVVSPHNVAVLDPGENEILTLVTCYPFYLVGSAPNRFIVRAERVDVFGVRGARLGQTGHDAPGIPDFAAHVQCGSPQEVPCREPVLRGGVPGTGERVVPTRLHVLDGAGED